MPSGSVIENGRGAKVTAAVAGSREESQIPGVGGTTKQSVPTSQSGAPILTNALPPTERGSGTRLAEESTRSTKGP